ncbi:MAG: 4-hydroxy-3-methylbut-2-enyl diphosphate reductase [Bacteroidetes bacterium]|nr:4-hydroxy-3-methylbut-2-enyl diphosphate reductase [Bacteroidota bacterium]
MQVTIDSHSGFCFGVVYAIEVAERELRKNPVLYCLGDIVHNNMEVNRLKQMGLVIITHQNLHELHGCKVLIRAHGEPPETYKIALQNQIELIDASCPIVLNLQNVIHRGYQEMLPKSGQIVIYGKEGHAEVNALKGQTNGTAIVIGDENDLPKIDFSRPVRFYSQTTKSVDGFNEIVEIIRHRMGQESNGLPIDFEWNDSICRQVSNRLVQLKEFAARFDVVVFVSGQKSSNGMILYHACKGVNPHTNLVSSYTEVETKWFDNAQTVGICGATSTPMWLMEEIAEGIRKIKG